ncbi:TraE/TraK family type IV conjugative transfer system protein [Noviherbaspirillum galbum]|uniref:Sex pilus assembly protein TraE n=1 Tax=Noviherbaspirillum galbum TaxID=2709383 RepID=A0A6B3SVH9_9BURK|nr:TraE/TraK family type IV conjugative transfer system protein [Noviherbaspirillum galbum]NEX63395.1 sex pilus assembly protein TraE [Noviherbaspirillum galbum]
MNLIKLGRNWKATLSANLLLAGALAASVMANLALTTKLATMHERLVLVPPMMTTETVVGWNEASKNFFEGWGLYAASMIGSATPKTAGFVAGHLEYIFDKSIFQAVRTQLLSIEKDPSFARTGSVNVFTPKTVTWEASTNRLFVSGQLTSTAYRARTTTLANVPVTYQMSMRMEAGAPKITTFTSYIGAARTAKWEREHPAEAQKLQRAADEKAAQILPQENEVLKAIESGIGSAQEIMEEGDGAATTPASPTGKPAAKPQAIGAPAPRVAPQGPAPVRTPQSTAQPSANGRTTSDNL